MGGRGSWVWLFWVVFWDLGVCCGYCCGFRACDWFVDHIAGFLGLCAPRGVGII